MLQQFKNKLYNRIINNDDELIKLRDEYRLTHNALSTFLYVSHKKFDKRGG